jgi:Ser/Thr protein kinase RdoA (MazF antagonist)
MWQYQQERPSLDMGFIEAALKQWNMRGAPLTGDDLGGAYNCNWHVVTPYEDVVVRVRPPWLTLQRLEGIHHLLELLAREAVRTPHLCRTNSGKTYDFVQGMLVEIYDYLPEAHNRQWSVNRWRAAFAHMAQLHTAFNHIRLNLTPPLVSNYAPPNLLQAMLNETLKRLEALPSSPDQQEALAICREALRVLLKIEVGLFTLKGELPRHLVHGDYHLDNLLFDEDDQVKYTLDFDFVASRDRIFEIAYALRLALPQLTDNDRCYLDSHLVREWLEIYNNLTSYPLTDAERKFLPYYIAYVSLFYIADACRVEAPLTQVLRESPYLELACHLVAHPESLLDGTC